MDKIKVEILIRSLFGQIGLGEIEYPIGQVRGGFLHEMYKVNTSSGTFAVKHLNPEIMKKSDAALNFANAEKLERILENAGIPIVPALMFNYRKLQEIDGHFFYVFRWCEGKTTELDNITANQCFMIGNILGQIHSLGSRNDVDIEIEESIIKWDELIEIAKKNNPEAYRLLNENKNLLKYAEEELNKARKLLPNIISISNEDMDPKNVMWENEQPLVIDLECLEYGNPVSNALQLSLNWSGILTCNFDPDCLFAFFKGYFNVHDNDYREYQDVYGLAYTWVEWFEYNIEQVLCSSVDLDKKKTWIEEAYKTLNRILCLYKNETEIRHELSLLKYIV